jgi:hypothetical protein
MNKEKVVTLSKKDIDSLKSIFEDGEIISDEEKKVLGKKRNEARKNGIILGELALFCFDTLSDYSYLFEIEENSGLKKRVEDYLSTFSDIIPKLRELVSDYEEDRVGSWGDGERIKEHVILNREKMSKLTNVFFGIVSGEEI